MIGTYRAATMTNMLFFKVVFSVCAY